MLTLLITSTVELSTLTIDEAGRPVAHIFKPAEIDARELPVAPFSPARR